MYWFKFSLILFIFLKNISFAATLDEKIAFLIQQKDYRQLVQKINLKHISHYIDCLEDEKKLFFFKYFDENGQIATKELTCTDVMPVVFTNRLNIEYSKMRIFLALAKTGYRDEAHIMSMSDNINYKININIDHPNDTSMTRLPYNIEKPAPLSKREIKKAMRTYNRYTKKMCKLYVGENLKRELESDFEFKKLSPKNLNEIQKNFCQGIDLMQYSKNIRYAFGDILNRYHRWLENRRLDFRKNHLNLYYKQINKSPYFLLIKTRTPTREELLRALKIIKENALDKEANFNMYTQENKVEEKIIDYQSGVMTDPDKAELLIDLTFYVNDPLFFKFYEIFGEKLSLEAKSEIDALISKNEFMDSAKEIGIITSGLAACFVPTQKLFKLLKFAKSLRSAKIFRLSCFTALGLPLNSWFIYQALERYESSITELLSSVDGRHLIRKYNSISRVDLVINTLFIASGVGAARLLVKSLKRP